MATKSRKKKIDVQVEVTDQGDGQPQAEATVEVDDKPILVAETENSENTTTTGPEIVDAVEPESILDPVSPPPDNSQIFGPTPEEPKSNKKAFWTIIIVFALLGALAGGVGIYLQNRGSFDSSVLPTPSPTSVASPTPTPSANLKREDLTIQVLNGSGVSGAAATAQEYLEGLGYTVADIGNADSSDVTATQVAIKADKKDYLEMLVEDLESEYSVDEDSSELDEDSEYDVVITLGSE